jgi:hypothetical protein
MRSPVFNGPPDAIFAHICQRPRGQVFAHSRRTLRGDLATRVGLGVECDLAHSAEVDVDAFLFASLWAAVGTLSPEKAIEAPGVTNC